VEKLTRHAPNSACACAALPLAAAACDQAGRLMDPSHAEQPLLDRAEDKRKGSSRVAFLNFFKSMFGCGVLSLPHAFQEAGLVAGIITYAIMCGVCIYSMVVIIACKHMLQRQQREAGQRGAPEIVTFGDVAFLIAGKWGKRAVDAQVVLLELLYNAGFQIVMASTIHTLVPSISHTAAVLMLFVPVCLLSFIRWLKDFWFLSLFGLLIYVVMRPPSHPLHAALPPNTPS